MDKKGSAGGREAYERRGSPVSNAQVHTYLNQEELRWLLAKTNADHVSISWYLKFLIRREMSGQ